MDEERYRNLSEEQKRIVEPRTFIVCANDCVASLSLLTTSPPPPLSIFSTLFKMSEQILIHPHSHSTPFEIPAPLLPLLTILSSFYLTLSSYFQRIPGSPILLRYIKSSYQNDPWRSLLEVLLVAFAVRTLLKGRTRGEGAGKNFIKLEEKVRVCSHSCPPFDRENLGIL